LLQAFFHGSSFLQALKITLGHITKFRKFAEIFASQNAPPVSTTPTANFATSTAGVVDTSAKFATGVNFTGGKFATGVDDTGGKWTICPRTIYPLLGGGGEGRCWRYVGIG
jgi:hypothetical protein